jgi:hypothetical protein
MDEAWRRLTASGCLPDRGSQPTQVVLSMGGDLLARLRVDEVRGSSGPAALTAASI